MLIYPWIYKIKIWLCFNFIFAYLPKNNVHNNHLSKFLASSKPLCIASLNIMYQVCGSLFQQASAAVSKENNQLLCKEMDHSKVLSMALNPSFSCLLKQDSWESKDWQGKTVCGIHNWEIVIHHASKEQLKNDFNLLSNRLQLNWRNST